MTKDFSVNTVRYILDGRILTIYDVLGQEVVTTKEELKHELYLDGIEYVKLTIGEYARVYNINLNQEYREFLKELYWYINYDDVLFQHLSTIEWTT